MLVLSRKPKQEIVINGNIRVSIESVRGQKVKVGIIAPGEVPVDRAEVHDLKNQWRKLQAGEVGS